jgi:ADP-ribose pyrophosphatase YjhB (NUDIX family)
MADSQSRFRPTSIELRGRVEWMHFVIEAARREGREITRAERSVFERYFTGEIDGDEARQQILQILETPALP